MDLLKDTLYHLSCPSCGADWWDDNAFPSYCPYCNTNRIPERTDKKDEESQYVHSSEPKSSPLPSTLKAYKIGLYKTKKGIKNHEKRSLRNPHERY